MSATNRDLTHCTHPDLESCDCDWCRLIRSYSCQCREKACAITNDHPDTCGESCSFLIPEAGGPVCAQCASFHRANAELIHDEPVQTMERVIARLHEWIDGECVPEEDGLPLISALQHTITKTKERDQELREANAMLSGLMEDSGLESDG